MTRAGLTAILLLVLPVGCAAPSVAPPPPAPPPVAVPPAAIAAGLDRVMGQDAATVIALLGQPALDAREGPARRLQFRGAACVLDAYLYSSSPPGPLRVTWVDARTLAGGEFDRASCIAALARR